MLPEKSIAFTDDPLHKSWSAGWFTTGSGFTVILKDFGVPGQPFAVAVTVITAVTGEDV